MPGLPAKQVAPIVSTTRTFLHKILISAQFEGGLVGISGGSVAGPGGAEGGTGGGGGGGGGGEGGGEGEEKNNGEVVGGKGLGASAAEPGHQCFIGMVVS